MSKRRGTFLTSADARPYKKQHQAPCSDCPWARKSIKGWTGPNSVAQWLAAARDYWFIIVCHTRKRFGVSDREEYSKLHWECAGAAIFRANTHVEPRYGSAEGRPLLQLPANRITVFASPAEFEAHHEKGDNKQ